MQNYITQETDYLDDLGNDFLNTTLTAPFMKDIIDKIDFLKIKNFLQKTMSREEDKPWQKTHQ